MYELYGLLTEYEYEYGGYTGRTIEHRDLVATFDIEEDARKYAEASYLSSVRKQKYRSSINGRVFLRKSLLDGYDGYEIDEQITDPLPPHNPEL